MPMVLTGQSRESVITLTNAGPEDVRVEGFFVGMEGTPKAASAVGLIACPLQVVPREGSLTLPLRLLCPGTYGDGDNIGYVQLTSRTADVRSTFFSTSVVETTRATSFGVAGQPVRAYDPGDSSGLQVPGLRTRQAEDETLFCYVASLGENKKGTLQIRDASGAALGSPWNFNLKANRMERVAIAVVAGLPAADREAISA